MTDDRISPPVGSDMESQAPTIAPSHAGSITDIEKVNDSDRIGGSGLLFSAEDEKKIEIIETESHVRVDGTEYPKGLKLFLICFALCLSVFLVALDNSIIATAIPKITNDFKSLPDVGWYGSAYLLTTSSLQLLFGKFYTFFSIKYVFLTAVAIFELGSLICGVSQNSVTLIIGRAVAGVGAAAIFSGALIILAYSVPLSRRPMFTGLIASMYGIASVSGPLLGGAFTDKLTWRWCFYINLPIGACAIAVIVLFFPDPHRQIKNDDDWRQRIKRFDPFGTAVFMPSIICLLLALQWGGTEYAWNSWRIILLFVFFGLLLVIFVFIQLKQQDYGTVPPRIISKRSVMAAAYFAFCIGAAYLGTVYFLPIWFQAVKGASAVNSGIMNLPLLISTVLMSIAAGITVTRFGYYAPFMITCSCLTAIGFGLLTTFKPDTGSPTWIGYQILAGAGIGFGQQQSLMAVQTVLDLVDVPTGTSIVVLFQTLGGSLAVSIAQNIFSNRLIVNIADYVPDFEDPSSVLKMGATEVQTLVPAKFLPGITLAYNDALTRVFVVFVCFSALSIVGALSIEWKSVKGKKKPADVGA
ncbi:major facilitator superfamily domain-containing protein [Podospora appendiculata]|uniref:Major facilitator superfamily domain-containing protein n=1 Tax=Podospora appendiculata TaxID=314037 RepID=A0AAE1CDY8_9PEZI|nr:major facilitator superfamily domain-containing protein [Podospora appendiculata]